MLFLRDLSGIRHVIEYQTYLLNSGTGRILINEDGDVAPEPRIQPDMTDLAECGRRVGS